MTPTEIESVVACVKGYWSGTAKWWDRPQWELLRRKLAPMSVTTEQAEYALGEHRASHDSPKFSEILGAVEAVHRQSQRIARRSEPGKGAWEPRGRDEIVEFFRSGRWSEWYTVGSVGGHAKPQRMLPDHLEAAAWMFYHLNRLVGGTEARAEVERVFGQDDVREYLDRQMGRIAESSKYHAMLRTQLAAMQEAENRKDRDGFASQIMSTRPLARKDVGDMTGDGAGRKGDADARASSLDHHCGVGGVPDRGNADTGDDGSSHGARHPQGVAGKGLADTSAADLARFDEAIGYRPPVKAEVVGKFAPVVAALKESANG